MRAGRMRSFVTIEAPVQTKGTGGSVVTTWDTFDKVWAEIDTLRGYEKSTATATWPGADSKIMIRYIAGLLPTMRIVFENNIYSILGINDVFMRHRELDLTCQSGVKAQ